MKTKKIVTSVVVSALLFTGLNAADALDDIVVTAKSNNSVKDTPGSISIITAEDIKTMSATSVKDVLRNVAGISMGQNSSSISGRQSISIRGTRAEDVLILIDGKAVSGSDAQIGHSDFQYSWVPISSIAKIEVIKGPMSALYGSQAIGGVINIITKKSKEKFYGSVDIEKGFSAEDNGGDSYSVSLNVGGKIAEKLSINVSAEKKSLDSAYRDNTLTTTKIEGKEIENIMVKLDFDIDETQSVYASIIRGTEERERYDSRHSSPALDNLYYDIERRSESVGYRKNFSEATLDLSYSSVESDSELISSNSTHYMDNKTFKADATLDMIENNFIAIGLEYKKDKYERLFDLTPSRNFSGSIDNTAIYIQDEIEVNDDFTLALGARYDDHEKFGGHVSPNVNIVYKLNAADRIKAGFGQAFKAPTVTQNSSTYNASAGPTVFHGNDDLEAEISRTVNLAYEHYGSDNVIKVTIFNTKVDDLITTETITSGPFTGDRLYVNVDEAKMYGAELEYSQNFTSDFTMDLSYNYLKTKDSTGAELDFRPQSQAIARMNTVLPFGINWSLSANYTGKQKDGTSDLGGYTLVATQLSKEVIKNMDVRVGSENLTDKDLYDSPYEIPARLIYVGLNYSF